MTEEYMIVSKTAIEKRIEELEKTQNIYAPSGHFPNLVMYERTVAEKHTLQYLLSQSTPLIPEIEKAFDAGYDLNTWEQLEIPNEERDYLNEQDYISNLKLDI